LPIDDQGIADWSFDDRCGVINYALRQGVKLRFADDEKQFPEQFGNNSDQGIV
jgi:hypothetical protein